MLCKRGLLAILLFVLALSIGHPVAAQELHITWSAEPLLGGAFKYGEWLPVRVTLANDGPDRRVEVRTTITSGEGQATYIRPVELPHAARKQVTLYVRPNSFSRYVTLRLFDGEQELGKRVVEVQPLSAWTLFVGVVADRVVPLPDVAAALEGPQREMKHVRFAAQELPDRAAGLRSLDALVLNDVDTSRLTPAQQQALAGWVQLGGRLIIGGGTGAAQTLAGLPDPLRPVRVRDTRSVPTLAGLASLANGTPIRVPGPFVVAEAEPRAGAEVVAEQEGLPLVVQRRLGDGVVIFVALDLGRSPFGEWGGAAAFWKRLVVDEHSLFPEGPPDMSRRDWEAGPMLSALTSLPSLELPAVRWVLLLLLVYILLVGPLNYLVLRRRRRLEWAWVTIPLLTLAFSGLSYGIGYGLRGGEVILNALSIVEIPAPDSPTAQVRTYVGLFSPTKRAYSLQIPGDLLAGPLGTRFGGPWGPPVRGGRITVVQDAPTTVRDLTVNQWSMQTFMAEGAVEAPVHLEAALRYENGRLVGAVANTGTEPLRDAVVVFRNDFTRLGDLAPGERKEVTLPLATDGQRTGPPLSFRLFREQFERPGPGGLDREVRVKQQMLNATLDAPVKSMAPREVGPLLLAWMDASPVPVAVEGTPQVRALGFSLLLVRVPLRFDERVAGLPPGLIPAQMVDAQGSFGTCQGSEGIGYSLGNGTLVLKFNLPPELHDYAIERLTLVLTTNGNWWQPPETALYDAATQEWVPLENIRFGANIIEDANRFVDPTRHAVRVRLQASGNPGGCLYVDLGLEGRRGDYNERGDSNELGK